MGKAVKLVKPEEMTDDDILGERSNATSDIMTGQQVGLVLLIQLEGRKEGSSHKDKPRPSDFDLTWTEITTDTT